MRKWHVRITTFILAAVMASGMTGCDLSGTLRNYLSQEAESSAEREDSPEIEKVRLIRVVDGDTLLVETDAGETYVRLIGVNAPESVAPDEYLEKTGKENTDEGKAASEFVRELLSGMDHLWLEYDEERTDQYGRTLAYAWLSEDRTDIENMLNARLVMEGLADPMKVRPNVRHADEIASLADDGR